MVYIIGSRRGNRKNKAYHRIYTHKCVFVFMCICVPVVSNSNDDVQESVYDSPSLASGESGNSGAPVRRD